MDPWEVAQAQVAVKYDPQQANLQRQIDMAKSSTATNETAIQGYGTAGRENIGNTYNKLYDWLAYGKADQQQQLGQQVANTNKGYDDTIARIQGYQQDSRSYIQKMAEALGQTGQGLVSGGGLEDSINMQLGRASAARNNYGGSLQDWTTKMGTIADMGISAAHQGEAQGRSAFESELLQMLGQNKYAGTIQETDAMNKLSDIMGLRQSDLIAMYNELYQAEWQRRFSQAQLEQEASIAQAQLDSAASEGAANRAASAGDDALDWAKFNEGKRQFDATSAAEAAAGGLAQGNWQKDYDLKANPKVDRGADAELFWSEDVFKNPKTKQNDLQAYLNFKATGQLPNWPAATSGGGTSGINFGQIGSNAGKMFNNPYKAGLTVLTNSNPYGLMANAARLIGGWG